MKLGPDHLGLLKKVARPLNRDNMSWVVWVELQLLLVLSFNQDKVRNGYSLGKTAAAIPLTVFDSR